MTKLEVRIHRANETKPVFPGLILKDNGILDLEAAVIIEAGTNHGKTAVSFHATDFDGKSYWFQTTGDLLDTLVAAKRGAEAHWAENPVPNIWKDKK